MLIMVECIYLYFLNSIKEGVDVLVHFGPSPQVLIVLRVLIGICIKGGPIKLIWLLTFLFSFKMNFDTIPVAEVYLLLVHLAF